MPHVDPDILALLALGEHVESPDDRAHLESCEECRGELTELEYAALVARSSIHAGEFIDPPDRVWSRISEELFPAADGPTSLAPVTAIGSSKRRRFAGLAVAAALALVIGGVGGVWLALRPVPVTVLASAQLEAFPGWSGSTGEALVEELPGGERGDRVDSERPPVRSLDIGRSG